MFGVAKKTVYTVIGFALKLKEDAGEIASEFSKKAEASEERGRDFVDRLLHRHDRYEAEDRKAACAGSGTEEADGENLTADE